MKRKRRNRKDAPIIETEAKSNSIPDQTPGYPPIFKEIEQDLKDYLDHIVSLGHEIDLKTKSQQSWLNENRNKYAFLDCGMLRINQETSDTCPSSSTYDYLSDVAPRIPTLRTDDIKNRYLVHTEDQLLYSAVNTSYLQRYKLPKKKENRKSNQVYVFTWPSDSIVQRIGLMKQTEGKKGHACTADNWDEEYGDDVTFQEMKRTLDVTENSILHNSIKKHNDDDDIVDDIFDNEKEAFDEMVQKAWHQAVHLASTTIVTSILSNSNNTTTQNNNLTQVPTSPIQSDGKLLSKDNDDDHKLSNYADTAMKSDDDNNDAIDNDNSNNSNNSNSNNSNSINKQFQKDNDDDHKLSNYADTAIKSDDDNTDAIDNDDDNNNNSNNSIHKHLQKISHRISSNQIHSIMKCKSLGIKFAPIKVFHKNDIPSYKCECCHDELKFKSNEHVYQHLFGNEKEKGCCWKIIKLKHYEIMQSLLQREGIHIIDGLLHILLKRGIQHMTSMKKKKKKKRSDYETNTLNWVHVLTFMKNELKEAMDMKKEEHKSCFDSNMTSTLGATTTTSNSNSSNKEEEFRYLIKVHDDILPFALNKDVLNKIISYTINRYGVSGNVLNNDINTTTNENEKK